MMVCNVLDVAWITDDHADERRGEWKWTRKQIQRKSCLMFRAIAVIRMNEWWGVYCLFSSNKILSRPLSVCRDSIEIIFWSFHVLLSLPRVLAPGWVTDSLSQRKSIGQMNLVASFIWSLGKLIICLYILNFHSFSRFIMPWSVQAEGDWSFLTIFNRRWLVVMTIPNFMSN